MPKLYKRDASACELIACKDCGIYQLCRLASGCEDPSVSNALVRRRFILRRGEFLYRNGDTFQDIYAVRHGSIKTYIASDDGKTQITNFLGSGELIGFDAIDAGRFDSEAIVLETTSVCEVSFSHFQGLSRKIPGLLDQLVVVMSHAILRDQQMMLLLGKKSATEKLATYLVNLGRHIDKNKSSPSTYKLTMSRRDIGNYLGLTQETICRILARFQEDGIIRIQRKYLHFVDMNRLRELASKIQAER